MGGQADLHRNPQLRRNCGGATEQECGVETNMHGRHYQHKNGRRVREPRLMEIVCRHDDGRQRTRATAVSNALRPDDRRSAKTKHASNDINPVDGTQPRHTHGHACRR